MQIEDLPLPVTATKADWIPGIAWLGFTPQGRGPNARNQCQGHVIQQMNGGLILERITQSFEEPSVAFRNHPTVAADRQKHKDLADRLVAVHRLRPTARPLSKILGQDEYGLLQDIWSSNGNRNRWSVAFPIVQTWEIVGKPKAHSVLSPETFERVYRSQNALLRHVDDRMRAEIASLEVVEIPAPNVWIAIEDEVAIAERDRLITETFRDISNDLSSALEGQTEERKVKIRKRATWLAQRFWTHRREKHAIHCDECHFDPEDRPDLNGIPRRRLFDIHHRNPLAEGIRYTSIKDFSLLCPTCHRIEHARLRAVIN